MIDVEYGIYSTRETKFLNYFYSCFAWRYKKSWPTREINKSIFNVKTLFIFSYYNYLPKL